MHRLSNLPTRKVLRAFRRAGWNVKNTGHKKPKHTILCKKGFDLILSIPRHSTVKKGLLGKLIKHAGLTAKEFFKYYK